MGWVILIIIVLIVVFKIGSKSGEVVGSVSSQGGMRQKYARLVELVLEGHQDAKVFAETRTYLRMGVMNYGGITLWHLQQQTGNSVIIQYEVKNNPAVPPFQLEWVFPSDMDQDLMMTRMGLDIHARMSRLL